MIPIQIYHLNKDEYLISKQGSFGFTLASQVLIDDVILDLYGVDGQFIYFIVDKIPNSIIVDNIEFT